MKYRIVECIDTRTGNSWYIVQRKGWFFWKTLQWESNWGTSHDEEFASTHEAARRIQRETQPNNRVIKEFCIGGSK